MSDVTHLLDAAAAGDRRAAAELLPLVYDQLRKLAAARMAAESPDQTLQPTALVHEAYLRLIGPADGLRWHTRAHFFAAADPACLANEEILAVHDALEQLAAEDAQAARLIQLRYFGGLSIEEAAAHLGIARSTAYEHWAFARASLRLKLQPE